MEFMEAAMIYSASEKGRSTSRRHRAGKASSGWNRPGAPRASGQCRPQLWINEAVLEKPQREVANVLAGRRVDA